MYWRALAPTMEPGQAKRAWNIRAAILQYLMRGGMGPRIRMTSPEALFVALAPRLDQLQVSRAADAEIAIMEKSKIMEKSEGNYEFFAALERLTALAPRLDHSQADRSADALIAILEKSKSHKVLFATSKGLVALAPQLESAHAKRAWDALIALLQKSYDVDIDHVASKALIALAPRLELSQANRAWDAVIAMRQDLVTGRSAVVH